jgi:hypothetical protein
MPANAIERRRRTLRIYGLVLLAAIIAVLVYCFCGARFDLSTPEKTLASFKRAMDEHRWSTAELCLTEECRAHYAAALADRRIFDFYSPYGYESELGKFVPDWRVTSVELLKDDKNRARARISGAPVILGGDAVGLWLDLVRCPDGLWRVDGPLEDFEQWYERLIPARARGWGKEVERR